MQPGNNDQSATLAEKLDQLRATDVVPSWNARDTWQDVRRALPENRRRSIVWVLYPLAAAATLLLAVVLLQRKDTEKLPSGELVRATTPEAPVTTLQPASSTTGFTTDISKANSLKAQHPSVSSHATEAPEPLIASQPQEGLSDTTASSAPVQATVSTYHRKPEVVYTLSEIMAEVPEREAPPKRYSGIFHNTAPADAPGGSLPRRRSSQQMQDQPDYTPITIN